METNDRNVDWQDVIGHPKVRSLKKWTWDLLSSLLSENRESIDNVINMIIDRNKKLRDKATSWKADIDFWEIDITLTQNELNNIPIITKEDIKIVGFEKRNCGGWSFRLVFMKINWEQYVAIEIPNYMKSLKLSKTYIWKQLSDLELKKPFIGNYIRWTIWSEIPNWWILKKVAPMKKDSSHSWFRGIWKPLKNIPIYDPSSEIDLLRENIKRGTRLESWLESMVLGEMLFMWLWENHVWFHWFVLFNRGRWAISYKRMLKEQESYLWLKLWVYMRSWHLVKWSCLFVGTDGNPYACIRGDISTYWVKGWVFSMRFGEWIDYKDFEVSSYPSL